MGEQDALIFFLDGLCGWAKIKLKRCGVQDLTCTIATAESLIEFKKESSKGQTRRRVVSAKVQETGTSLLGTTSHPHQRTKERERRMRHQERSHASYAMDLTKSLSIQNGANLLLLSKMRIGKGKKGR